MELKKLMVDVKTAWLDYPGMPGFEVEVANISRKELMKIRTNCLSQKMDRRSRQMIEHLDEEKFATEFAKASIKNWKGFKLEYGESLMLIDTEGKDLDSEIPYSEENAEVLLTCSSEFDNWLNEVVFDLENFRSNRKGHSVRKTGATVSKSAAGDK